MKQYGVTLHKEHEKDLIEYVEKKKKDGQAISATFKAGLQKLIESDGE